MMTTPTPTLTLLSTLSPPSNSRTWQTAPHPTQPIVATACSDRSVRVYSLTSFTLLHSITGGHKRSVRSCSWKPHTQGQSVLATGSFDSSAGIWRKEDSDGLEHEVGRQVGDEEDEDAAAAMAARLAYQGVNKRRTLTPLSSTFNLLSKLVDSLFGVGSRSAPIVTPPQHGFLLQSHRLDLG